MKFTIKRGKHYSNNFIYKIINFFNFKNSIKRKIYFDETSLYEDDTIDKFDVNKLVGFSMGFHHINSYRFGWNCLNNKIYLYAYAYVDGVRVIKDMCNIELNTEHTLTIKVNGSKVVFMVFVNGKILSRVTLDKPKNKMIGYNLWPYFGGNKLAPHDIVISIKKNIF